MFNEIKHTFTFEGKEITVSSGKLARQAKAAIELRCNDTVLLAIVSKSDEPRKDADFFPLIVDFEEKIYSVGRIPGSYNRREGKASDKAVLVSRLIDRPVRPLFPSSYRNEVQISVLTLSTDATAQPDTLAMLAVGFALEAAGMPTASEFGAVRVALNEAGDFIANPTEEEVLNSDLDIVVAATEDSVMMVEAGANFVEDSKVVDSIEHAHKLIQQQIKEIRTFVSQLNVEKEVFVEHEIHADLMNIITENATADIEASMVNATKESRREFVKAAKTKVEEAIAALPEDHALHTYLAENPFDFANAMKKFEKKLLRAKITDTGIRADGRVNTQVRSLDISVGGIPAVHGNGLFTRGNTQVLSLLTLASERMSRSLDGLDSQTEKFYMHNYNFPAWSVGEVRPNRGPGRREIGHGALAERAVEPSLPSRESFPYAMRIVSEVLESAGSTSMASTCASSLALLDAGVPVKCPVAGVAMGLIHETTKSTVLTDIHELEDFLGDMDFKVAGNADGISALQMDIKIQGISLEVIRDAITQAKGGRLEILKAMTNVIAEPRKKLKKNAPQIITTKVPQDKIGAVIGPGGKNIKWLIEETNTDINISDDGVVAIYSSGAESNPDLALKLIDATANGVKQGEKWTGKVVKILEGVGAIIELFPGTSGLVHISQIANEKVQNIEDYLSLDQEIEVLVQGTDFKGRVSLSKKALLEDNSDKENNSEEKA